MQTKYEWILGDCLEKMISIPDSSIDLILCDLPQGITRNPWDKIISWEPLWKEYKRIAKATTPIVLFSNQPFTSELVMSNKKMFKYSLVWKKTTSTGFLNAKKMPLRSHEDICVFYKKRPLYNPQKTTGHKPVNKYTKHTSDGSNYGNTKQGISGGGSTERYPKSVLEYKLDKQYSKLHSTQKPVALLEYLINTYTNPGDIVLDNSAGSNSTGIAALKTGRRYIGIEKDPEIWQIGSKRVEEWLKDSE